MPRDLRDKVILITGASSGIGAATAVECARAGMHVALGARRADKLAEVAKQVEALGRRALVVPCDVNRDEDVNAFVARTLETFGRLDAAFANAGYGFAAAVADMTDADMRAIFETNYFGTLRVVRAVVPVMRNAASDAGGVNGHVLICSSASSEVPLPMLGAYSATKAAQDSMAGALGAELAGEGIAVTSVHPITTQTEFGSAMKRLDGRQGSGATALPITRQSARHVARDIVRAMRRTHPPTEVWPHTLSRYVLALGTAFPGVRAWFLRRYYERVQRELAREARSESTL